MPSLPDSRSYVGVFAAGLIRWMSRGHGILLAGVVALFSVGPVRAQDGSLQWRLTVQGWITLSSPALSPDGETVYVGVETLTGGRVVAASTRDGRSRWTNQGRVVKEGIESSPAVAADGTIYIGSFEGKLYSLKPTDGSINWDRSLGGAISSSPALGSDGTIYVGSGDGSLHAVSPTGLVLWSFRTGGMIFSSPAIAADGTIFIGTYDAGIDGRAPTGGSLYAITPGGEEKWRFRTNGEIFSSPAIGADGTLYFGSTDQRLYAVAPDGTKRWDYMTNGPVDASPALAADGTVYFAADRTFYALRPGDTEARLRWRAEINSGSLSSAAVRGDGTIIVGADDGVVRALNPDTGAEMWRFKTDTGPDNAIESSPIVGPDGSIYIGSMDGGLYKLTGNGSPLSAYSSWPAFRRDQRHTGRAAAANTGGKLVNISTRAQAGDGRNLIAGFVVQSAGHRAYLIRGVGPGLQSANVAGFMPDPRLEMFSLQVQLRRNDNWLEHDEATNLSLTETALAVQAFRLPPGSADAALLPALPPGAYTAQVNSADGRPGVALVEVYDGLAGDPPDDPTARLINLSTRADVGTGENILIAGFVVGGTGPMRLLLRGIGPGLSQFGVGGVLARPRLTLFRGGTEIGSNTGWTTSGYKRDLMVAAATVSAFPLADDSSDSAMLFTASPGAYTLQIAGVGDTTGEAMAEIYVLP